MDGLDLGRQMCSGAEWKGRVLDEGLDLRDRALCTLHPRTLWYPHRVFIDTVKRAKTGFSGVGGSARKFSGACSSLGLGFCSLEGGTFFLFPPTLNLS